MTTKTDKKIIIVIFFLLVFVTYSHRPSFAACSLSSTTISADCSYTGTNIYLDAGTGTTNTFELQLTNGATLTLTDGQTLYVPKIKFNGGVMGFVGTTKIDFNQGIFPKWMLDADSDGYPGSATVVSQATSPGTGYRRLNSITYPSTPETATGCDALATRNPGITTYSITAASDGTWDFNCNGVNDLQYTENAKYVCSTTGCAAHYYSNVSGWEGSSGYPACGAAKAYNTAQGAGINKTCTASNCDVITSLRVQGCR